MTALIKAASKGHAAIVSMLLEKGADIEAKDLEGRTALDVTKDWATRSILTKAGATSIHRK